MTWYPRHVSENPGNMQKAEAAVAEAKKKYDAALDELEKLVTKKKQLDDKRILDAYHASSKTAEEIVAFLNLEK